MAHRDANSLMKIQEDKDFLDAQREKGRRGSMLGIDKTLAALEERVQLRKYKEEQRRRRMDQPGASIVSFNFFSSTDEENEYTEEERDVEREEYTEKRGQNEKGIIEGDESICSVHHAISCSFRSYEDDRP